MSIYNCPNCGAPIGYSDVCEYCGTRLKWEPFVADLYFCDHRPVEKVEACCMVDQSFLHNPNSKDLIIEGLVGKIAKHVLRKVSIVRRRSSTQDHYIYIARIGFVDFQFDKHLLGKEFETVQLEEASV